MLGSPRSQWGMHLVISLSHSQARARTKIWFSEEVNLVGKHSRANAVVA